MTGGNEQFKTEAFYVDMGLYILMWPNCHLYLKKLATVSASCDRLLEKTRYMFNLTHDLDNAWLLIQSDPPQQIGASEAVELER